MADADGAEEAPLPSGETAEPDAEASPPESPRPPMPQFKLSTFVLTFLFVLGILMIFDSSTRQGVATVLGLALLPAIGFGHNFVMLTMFCAALIEMALTALAYNWATDWVKTSRIQSWSAAFRKVQMEALRSGKKDRVSALKPHQTEITRLSSELSFSQLKGMAVTWFLVIAIYTWVGLFIAGTALGEKTVNLGGSLVNIGSTFHLGPFPIPFWILLFSLYTFPLSYVLRRSLKHYSLRRYELKHLTDPPNPPSPSA
ncbi:MAG: EMC3/TMCO1 family protein [Thermoplasmata archaeon]|nr:EMC3/TMCO1 family protein [Thermoplasmata archaeon]MCI4359089.1 EMC3/TMCO1 family protein [Thermoplasmata archaeon]